MDPVSTGPVSTVVDGMGLGMDAGGMVEAFTDTLPTATTVALDTAFAAVLHADRLAEVSVVALPGVVSTVADVGK